MSTFSAGSIIGTLGLNTTQFKKGFDEAHTHAETEGGKIREVLQSIGEVVTEALGPAFGQLGQTIQSAFAGFSEGPIIGGLNLISIAVSGVREATEAAAAGFEEMNLAAEKLGVGVEWMSRLAAVAKTVHVNVDMLGLGLRVLEQRASEAAEGNKEAIRAFERVGISAQQAGQMMNDPARMFDLLRERIAAMEDPSKRTEAVMELMGRGGSALIPVLSMQADKFDRVSHAAEQTGAIVSEQDAKMGDATGELETVMSLAVTGIEKAASKPILKFLRDHMIDIEAKIEAATKAFVQAMAATFDFLASASKSMGPTIAAAGAAFKVAFDFLGKAIETLQPVIATMAQTFADGLKDMGKYGPEIKALANNLSADFTPAVKALGPVVAEATKLIVELSETVAKGLYAAFVAVEPALKVLGVGMEGLLKDVNDLLKGLDDLISKTGAIHAFFADPKRFPFLTSVVDAVIDKGVKDSGEFPLALKNSGVAEDPYQGKHDHFNDAPPTTPQDPSGSIHSFFAAPWRFPFLTSVYDAVFGDGDSPAPDSSQPPAPPATTPPKPLPAKPRAPQVVPPALVVPKPVASPTTPPPPVASPPSTRPVSMGAAQGNDSLASGQASLEEILANVRGLISNSSQQFVGGSTNSTTVHNAVAVNVMFDPSESADQLCRRVSQVVIPAMKQLESRMGDQVVNEMRKNLDATRMGGMA